MYHSTRGYCAQIPEPCVKHTTLPTPVFHLILDLAGCIVGIFCIFWVILEIFTEKCDNLYHRKISYRFEVMPGSVSIVPYQTAASLIWSNTVLKMGVLKRFQYATQALNVLMLALRQYCAISRF